MVSQIKLQPVDQQNFREVIGLELDESQKAYVSTNVFSMAEVSINPDYQPRALLVEEKVVGFVMYTEWVNANWMKEQKPGEYYIFRAMIDKNEQGKGYGRKMMELVLDEIKAKNPKIIHIVYCDQNVAARSLYKSLGFVENGRFDCGDLAARIEF